MKKKELHKMTGVRLSPDLDARLSSFAKKTHRSKSYYIRQALEKFLEDQEDLLLAIARYERLQQSIDKPIPLAEIAKELEELDHKNDHH